MVIRERNLVQRKLEDTQVLTHCASIYGQAAKHYGIRNELPELESDEIRKIFMMVDKAISKNGLLLTELMNGLCVWVAQNGEYSENYIAAVCYYLACNDLSFEAKDFDRKSMYQDFEYLRERDGAVSLTDAISVMRKYHALPIILNSFGVPIYGKEPADITPDTPHPAELIEKAYRALNTADLLDKVFEILDSAPEECKTSSSKQTFINTWNYIHKYD